MTYECNVVTRPAALRGYSVAAFVTAALLVGCEGTRSGGHTAPSRSLPPTPHYAPPPSPPPPLQPPLATRTPDPIETADLAWMRAQAARLLGELVAALPEPAASRVRGIPLAIDDAAGEVNASAACIRGGAILAVTDGLLLVAAELARAQASDERHGTHKVDRYVSHVARSARPGAPLPAPPADLWTAAELSDAQRIERGHAIFDEFVAFALGHELAHHHLGHLPCTGTPGAFGMGEIARGLSGTVPLFNQPNEVAADVSGMQNVLTAGARRSGYRLGEGGALLMMRFFSGIDGQSPIDVLFAFERTHPPPFVRVPAIQQTAAFFRATGGGLLPVPRL